MAKKYVWYKQKMADNCEIIECPPYDPIEDFVLDASGYYVLIRPNIEMQKIEVAVCDQDHNIIKIFIGKSPQELYHTIFKYEKDHGVEYFTDKNHIAYLGKEYERSHTFDQKIVKKLGVPYTIPKAQLYILNTLQIFRFDNFFWDRELKKNNALDKRLDKPFM